MRQEEITGEGTDGDEGTKRKRNTRKGERED
jgi:hypothetical protein